MNPIETALNDLEQKIRADERERLANEFYERGDIGTLPGETSIIAWLLKSEGGGGQNRRITREDYLNGLINNRGERISRPEPQCVHIWHICEGQKCFEMRCGGYESYFYHDPTNRDAFGHPFKAGK